VPCDSESGDDEPTRLRRRRFGARRLVEHVGDVVEPGVRAARKLEEVVPGDVVVPAWRRVTRGEPRWPVAIGVLGAIGMQLALPTRVTFQHQWVLPAIELAMLVVLVVANPGRLELEDRWLRRLSIATFAPVIARAVNILK
jgi:hypothetical protein